MQTHNRVGMPENACMIELEKSMPVYPASKDLLPVALDPFISGGRQTGIL